MNVQWHLLSLHPALTTTFWGSGDTDQLGDKAVAWRYFWVRLEAVITLCLLPTKTKNKKNQIKSNRTTQRTEFPIAIMTGTMKNVSLLDFVWPESLELIFKRIVLRFSYTLTRVIMWETHYLSQTWLAHILWLFVKLSGGIWFSNLGVYKSWDISKGSSSSLMHLVTLKIAWIFSNKRR